METAWNLPAVEAILHYNKITQSLYVAAFAVLIWDYILTFEKEVRFVWPQRWSTVQILYLLGRYFPIFAQMLNVITIMSPHVTESFCGWWLKLVMPAQLATVWIISSAVVMHRIGALYSSDKNVMRATMLLWIFTIGCGIIIACTTISPDRVLAELAPGIQICYSVTRLPYLFAVAIPPIFFDFVACTLATYKVYSLQCFLEADDKRSATYCCVLARDSLLYFCVLMGAFISELMMLRFIEGTLGHGMHGFSIALCSICSNRIVLNTRELNAQEEGEEALPRLCNVVNAPRDGKGKERLVTKMYP